MISVGIVSVQRTNSFFSYLRGKKLTVCEEFGKEPVFVPVRILIGKDFKRKTLLKRVRKAEMLLREKGVSDILYTRELRELIGIDEFDGIPYASLMECFCFLCKNDRGIYKRIHLYDESMSFFNYLNMSGIVCRAKEIAVYTRNPGMGYALAEEIYSDFGVWIEVCDLQNNNSVKSQIIIDADKGKIRVGDVMADGVVYDTECNGYDVDLRFIANNPHIIPQLKIKYLAAGKNLIKFS